MYYKTVCLDFIFLKFLFLRKIIGIRKELIIDYNYNSAIILDGIVFLFIEHHSTTKYKNMLLCYLPIR